MSKVTVKCPGCGAEVEIDNAAESAKCPYCGTELIARGTAGNTVNNEKLGYEFEKGRIKAQQESGTAKDHVQPENKPERKHKHRLLKFFAWVVFFPIALTIWLWSSDTAKKWNRNVRIVLTAAVWLLFGGYYLAGRTPNSHKVKKEDVYLSDWMDECFAVDSDVKLKRDKNDNVTVSFDLKCDQAPQDYISSLFSEHDLNMQDFTLEEADLEFGELKLSKNGWFSSAKAEKIINDFLNMQEGEEKEFSFTVDDVFDYQWKNMVEASDFTISMNLAYEGPDPDGSEGVYTVCIPWKTSLATPTPEPTPTPTPEPTEEPTPEPTVETTPEPTPEPTAEAAASGIRPEFQEAMDSYEAFIDEYCDFMRTYSSTDDTTALMTEYLEYMTKLADMEAKMDAVDESTLTPEEDALYTQVMTRTSAKLIQVSGEISG